MEYWWHN